MLAVSLPAVLFQCGEQKVFNLNGDFVNFAAQEKFFRQLDPAPEKIQQFPIGHSLTRLSALHMCKVGGKVARTGNFHWTHVCHKPGSTQPARNCPHSFILKLRKFISHQQRKRHERLRFQRVNTTLIFVGNLFFQIKHLFRFLPQASAKNVNWGVAI